MYLLLQMNSSGQIHLQILSLVCLSCFVFFSFGVFFWCMNLKKKKKETSSDQKKMDGQVRYVFDDSSSNDQCDKGVMKVPPETSRMSAVRALWSCDLLGYFC